MEGRMISASFVEEALDSLRQRGLSAERVLAAATKLNDDFFGLAARPMRPGGFTLLCHCLLHTHILEQALRRALRFLNLVLEEPRGELVIENGLARVELHESGPPRSAFAYRTYWILLHGVICWSARRRLPLRRVDFRNDEPDFCGDHRLFFGEPAQFGTPLSVLAFDQAFLRVPINRNEARFLIAPRGDFKNEFIQAQACSALRNSQTTFVKVNFNYIAYRDPTFRKPNSCTRIHNAPSRS
jgi:hypothetical protein